VTAERMAYKQRQMQNEGEMPSFSGAFNLLAQVRRSQYFSAKAV
jgi:hypothetical protein